jgi:uncharacterized protein YycO
MQVQRTQPQVTVGERVGHAAVNIALSVGTGIAADQLRKSALRLGSVQSVVVGLAGAAAVKAVGEGSVQVISNLRHDRKWNADLGHKMLDGARTGTIDGALTFVAAPIARGVGARMPQLGTIARHATTGLVMGTLGGAAYSATDRQTWNKGAGEGLKQVGISTAIGAAGGAIIGAGTGAVMKRFFPEYKAGGDVNEHQVRTLARQRGQQVRPDIPELNNTFEAAVANAKTVTRVAIPKGTNMAKLAETQEFQTFAKDLKVGDIIIGGRGTKVLAWATKSPYTHAMVVTEANGTVAGTKVVEAIETGVVRSKLTDALAHYVPGHSDASSEIHGAYTIIRPTSDGAIAAKAAAWAEKQVGQPYNYSFEIGGGEGKFCSQLAYEAYDANPAIPQQIKLLQLDEDASRLKMILSAGKNGSVGRMMERDWLGLYDKAPLHQKIAMKAQDYGGFVAGLVRHGASKAAGAMSATGGKVYTPNYRYEPLTAVGPGDLNLADGRKIHTLMLDLIGGAPKK